MSAIGHVRSAIGGSEFHNESSLSIVDLERGGPLQDRHALQNV